MSLARQIPRLLAISGSAYITAAAASVCVFGIPWALSLFTSDAPALPDTEFVVSVASLGAYVFGTLAAVIAVPILWRSELRRSIPITAGVTVLVAVVSGVLWLLPGLEGIYPVLMTLFAGVLTMLFCRTRLPDDRPRVRRASAARRMSSSRLGASS